MKEKIDPKSLPLAARITDGQRPNMGLSTFGVLSTFWRIEGHPGLYTCRSKPPSGFQHVVAAFKVEKSKLSWSKFVRELTIEKILGLTK